ncbi:hypothetical protein [Novosphingobium sp. ST904]|uniref:hypothetical protein n=1 Tax=Novosphingobium sp. ST904 TaxID=1684385 RepID=UPI000B1E432E
MLTAGTILGRDNLEASTDLVPFMFKATLDEDAAANTVVVDIARRTVAELGLNRSQATAYNAIFTALSQDEKIEDVFLGITNGDQFRQTSARCCPTTPAARSKASAWAPARSPANSWNRPTRSGVKAASAPP